MTDTTAPPLPEPLVARLLKTLRLAQDGVGGERDNAEVILDKLLAKHKLTRAALDEMAEPVRGTVWFKVAVSDRVVFHGLVARLFGDARSVWKQRVATKRGVDLSPAERVTFDLAWEVYKKAWKRVQHDVLIAYMRKHKLFDVSKPARYVDDLTPEEQVEYERQQRLARALDTMAAPGTKQITRPGR